MSEEKEKKEGQNEEKIEQGETATPKYVPPKIQKFEKLEKLILSGE
jgi:hypothetical protein